MKPFSLLSFLLFTTHATQAQDTTLRSLGLKPPAVHNCTPVKDQYYSSTCWSFSSVSLIESEEMKKAGHVEDLSEMFIARYSYIRKIETHLKLKGKNFFTPGGQFHDAAWVMKNYGMVPESVYAGMVKGESHHNHSDLDSAIAGFIRPLIANGTTALTVAQYNSIDSILDHHLGKVPQTFTYKGHAYTPKTFLQDYLRINPDDYVEITSYRHHPFYQTYVLEDKYNWTGDRYYNVPVEDMVVITDEALQHGYTVGWDGDVEEPGFQFQQNYAALSQGSMNWQIERQYTMEDGSTAIDHMMHIVAKETDKRGNDWYYVKNSWGTYSNSLKGFLFMSKDFFAIKTGAIIVNKNAIPTLIRKKMAL